MDLRTLLADPPWLKGSALPDILPGAESVAIALKDAHVPIFFRPLERERLLAKARIVPYAARRYRGTPPEEIDAWIEREVTPDPQISLHLLLGFSDDDAARLLASAPPNAFASEPDSLEALVARLGARAAPGLIRRGQDLGLRPCVFRMLLHVGTPLAAPLLLDAFLRLRSLRGVVKRCLLRFVEPMLDALLPLAAGAPADKLGLTPVQKPAELVRGARLALHFLADAGERARIEREAKKMGLAEAWALVAASDPLAGKGAPRLADALLGAERPLHPTGDPLGDLEWERFLAWLALLDWDTANTAPARELDEPSLHRSMRSLLDAWLGSGASKADAWVVSAVVELGGKDTVRALRGALRKWRALHQTPSADVLRAVGVAATRHFGTPIADAALELLAETAVKGSSASQEATARSVIEWVDDELDEVDDLAERLVPSLGLDERGRMRLDYGPRSFQVCLDTTLELYVVDDGGARLAKLPSARKTDDPAKAKAAKAAMTALGRESRMLVARVLARMEAAMRTQKSWDAAAFQSLIVRHPVVGCVARGLVWTAWRRGALVESFRICEDLTFANADDDAFALAQEHSVTLAHPALATEDVWVRWSRVLGDYEIIQPIPQLAWPVFRLGPEERSLTSLERASGAVSLNPLTDNGWMRGPWSPEAGDSCTFEKVWRGVRAMLFYDPKQSDTTFDAGPLRLQKLETSTWDEWLPMSSLDPVSMSEVLRELALARA